MSQLKCPGAHAGDAERDSIGAVRSRAELDGRCTGVTLGHYRSHGSHDVLPRDARDGNRAGCQQAGGRDPGDDSSAGGVLIPKRVRKPRKCHRTPLTERANVPNAGDVDARPATSRSSPSPRKRFFLHLACCGGDGRGRGQKEVGPEIPGSGGPTPETGAGDVHAKARNGLCAFWTSTAHAHRPHADRRAG